MTQEEIEYLNGLCTINAIYVEMEKSLHKVICTYGIECITGMFYHTVNKHSSNITEMLSSNRKTGHIS